MKAPAKTTRPTMPPPARHSGSAVFLFTLCYIDFQDVVKRFTFYAGELVGIVQALSTRESPYRTNPLTHAHRFATRSITWGEVAAGR